MLSTKDKIIKASIEVFSIKGYAAATTLEISKEANVSEMTLFRHFKTKENLFLTAVKSSIGKAIEVNYNINFDLKLKDFIFNLLHEKFLIISENIKIIKMLIRESLSNVLPSDLNFTKQINSEIYNMFKDYFIKNNLESDFLVISDILVGILIRYAVMNGEHNYHLLNKEDQKQFVKRYVNSLNL